MEQLQGVQREDKFIIMTYCELEEEAKVVFVNEDNTIKEVGNYEKHGQTR